LIKSVTKRKSSNERKRQALDGEETICRGMTAITEKKIAKKPGLVNGPLISGYCGHREENGETTR